MRPRNLLSKAVVLLLLCGAAGPAAAQTVGGPVRGVRAVPPRVEAPRRVEGPVTTSGIDLQLRIPNVVGMNVYEAESRLQLQGFEVEVKFLDQPDRSFGPGQVSVQLPSAGTVQSRGKVVLKVPLAASLVGIGTLSDADLERRVGFDFDSGRLEQVTHGADMVLRHHDDTRALQDNGTAYYYYGHGTYAEPSDGAFFDALEYYELSDGIGAYSMLALCLVKAAEFPRSSRWRKSSLHLPDSEVGGQQFCVHTADGHVAVVSFTRAESTGEHSDYIFHFALFPQIPLEAPRLPARPLRSVTRR